MIIENVRLLSNANDLSVSYVWRDGRKTTSFFATTPEEMAEVICLLEIADNVSEMRSQLDRLLTAKRLFDEGYALLKELR